MRLPLNITFRGISPIDGIEADIRDRAARLDDYYANITSCHVTIGIPHRHHGKGNRFSVRIDVTVPGRQLVVTRESRPDVAIHEAFDAADRQVHDYASRRRVGVKTHEAIGPDATA
jgi:ribosome-associated translation inhibitor RaiA